MFSEDLLTASPCTVYASRRVPQKLVEDPVLFGECLSGALYWKDFVELAKKVGFADPRLVQVSTEASSQSVGVVHQPRITGYRAK